MNKKLKKLFRSPSDFIRDSFLYRKILRNKKESIYLFIGFSTWKQYLRKYFSGNKIVFLNRDSSSAEINQTLRQYRGCQIEVFVWGYKIPSPTLKTLTSAKIFPRYVEDGFIRSIDLGATKCPPMSLCIDKKAPYFDATQETELEKILNEYDFSNNKELISRARSGIRTIIENKISKYNNSPHRNVNEIYGVKNTKRILVIGQVEDDASIHFGCNKKTTNNDVVKLAAKENPSAQIIYKPHPDVINGFREKQSNPAEVKHLCQILYDDISLASSLDTIDHVYTITSLSGFEALIRGIKVTTLGDPFYSSWGLTDDRQPNNRKKRALSVEEIFAASYILYPKYFEPNSGDEITFEDVVSILIRQLGESSAQSLNNNTNTTKNGALIQSQKTPGNTISIQHPNNTKAIEKIKLYLKDGNIEYAHSLANQLWEEIPWNIELSLLISSIYRKKSEFDSAIFICDGLMSRVKNWRVALELYYCLQERGDKSDKMEAILRDAVNLSPQNSAVARFELIKYLWSTKGTGPSILYECNYLMHKQDAFNLNASHHMLIAAIFCDAGRYLLSERQFMIAKNKDPEILSKVQYFHLMNYLRLKGLLTENQSNLIEMIYNKINQGQSYFEDLIRKNADSFCVVGNAPTELGKRMGADIDSNNLVIRFNAYSTSYPEFIDYGLKTNIWVKTGAYLDVPRRNLDGFDLVVISGYNPVHRNTMGVDLFIDFIDKKTKVCVIPNHIYEELFDKIGATPSAGLAIVYWIYKTIGHVNLDNIYGFSFGKQEKHASEHYFKNAHKVKYSSHLWDFEADILKECISN
ncbi:TPA: glycosyltransferase family 29 protein [Aeromonas veronii]|nr:glycosyltransferase family 29 protein [Aeromonas veronii]